jgi:hypothetical protein
MAPTENDDPTLGRDLKGVFFILLPLLGLATAGVVLFSFAACAGCSCSSSSAATMILVAAAACTSGAILGLLFGIPRALSQGRGEGDPKARADAPRPSTEAGSGYGHNTNLEQISDWLTKIIVGAGLVEAKAIYVEFGRLSREVATGLCTLAANSPAPAPTLTALAGGLILFFGAWGFLAGYLFTRRALPGLFRRGDLGGMSREETADALERGIDSLITSRRGAGGAREAVEKLLPGVEEAVKELTRVQLPNVPAGDLLSWGQAQIFNQDYASAVVALSGAKLLHPKNVRVVEDLVFAALYLEKPRSFEQALAAGESFPDKSPRLAFLLAAAHAQRHAWLEARGASAEEQSKERDLAYELARDAIHRDPDWTPVLADLMEPRGEDDDFRSLAADAPLRELARLPPR